MSIAWSAASRLRNGLFDLRISAVHPAPVPVVSVGNITAGGTGKTPVVAWLSNWFANRNIRVALLSRGYRSLDDTANDEKLVLDQLCPGIPHVLQSDRVAGAATCAANHAAQVIVLDDGFQHRRLARDLDIVLVDATNPWGYGHLLPRGLLREPLSGLRRAHLIAVTRVDHVDDRALESIVERIAAIRSSGDHVRIAFPVYRVVNHDGWTRPLAAFQGKSVGAMCGIGNPAAFRRTLEQAGIAPTAFLVYPDHHHYSATDLREVSVAMRACDAVLTTQKDLVKIPRPEPDEVPLYAVEIRPEIVAGTDLIESRCQQVLDTALLSASASAQRTTP